MALPYTFTALQNAVTHATGKTAGLDSGNSAADVVNDALITLALRKPWRWRRKALSLDFTADQSYVALPADFEELWALTGAVSTVGRAMPTDLQDIVQWRQTTGATGQTCWYAVSITPQTSATASPVARLEIYPTPAATVSAALTGYYLRRPPLLSGGTDLPDMPVHFCAALKYLARAMGKASEGNDQDPDWSMYQTLLLDLERSDALSQPSLGAVRGTTDFVQNQFDSDVRFFPGSSAVLT